MVVTRTREQASTLVTALAEQGADPLEVPVIAIAPPADGGADLRRAAAELGRYDWIVVTSANGVRALVEAVGDPDRLREARVAVVGPATAAALREAGVTPALLPERFVAEGLLEVFPVPGASGARVLLAQAEAARDVLATGLAAAGWEVDAVVAYCAVAATIDPALAAQVAAADAVTFTSSSTVEHFVAAFGTAAVPRVVACIGPVTAARATELGLEVDVVAEPHTVPGLVDALAGFLDRRP